jgi:hypothetical protein
MQPDMGYYEERYRLTGSAALGLAASLLAIGLGLLWDTQVIFAVVAVLGAAVAALGGGVVHAARRAVAFRADYEGITLGTVPSKLPFGRSAVFVPWADVEQIILYRHKWGGVVLREERCIGIRRREGAPPLPRGNEQAPGCPVPGVAAGASRKVTGWRLDRERLAAVTAAVAPGIPIIEAGTASGLGVEGTGQSADPPELGPAD